MTPADITQKMVDAASRLMRGEMTTSWQEMIFAAIRADPETAKAIAEHVEHKKCAHCGCEGELRDNVTDGYSIACTNLPCQMQTNAMQREEYAWAVWDRRVEK